MYIQQAKLLRGLDRNFIRSFMDTATKESHEEGDFLFHSGEKAQYFFVLVSGHIRLSLGIFGHVVHVVHKTGEAFGWSSLVGRSLYSASAECVTPTKVLKFESEKVQEVSNKYPAGGLVFFRRLGKILGDRLLQSYATMPSASETEDFISFGTGQVMETPAI